MNQEDNAVQATAPDALQDFTSCPHWGKGGQFIYDPVTKIRTPVMVPGEEPVAEAATGAQSVDAEIPPSVPTTNKKERARA